MGLVYLYLQVFEPATKFWVFEYKNMHVPDLRTPTNMFDVGTRVRAEFVAQREGTPVMNVMLNINSKYIHFFYVSYIHVYMYMYLFIPYSLHLYLDLLED